MMNNRTEAKLTDLSGMQKAIEEILKQAWERGRKYGQNEERPQGEWIKEEGYSYHYECNICHERPLRSRWCREDEFSNFCPNCGAKMKGGEEE